MSPRPVLAPLGVLLTLVFSPCTALRSTESPGENPPAKAEAAGEAAVLSSSEFPGIDDRWLEVSTDAFTVLSNAKPKKIVSALEELETFRAMLRLLFPALGQTPRRTTHVYWFDSARQFETYATDRPSVAGFFTARPEANYIVVDGTSSIPYRAVLHEYVHYLLRNNIPDLPLWLNEGLAEYLDGFRVSKGQGIFGGDKYGILLIGEEWFDFEEIFAARGTSEIYRNPGKSIMFRAQAWALTRFLYDPDNRQVLIRFMQGLADRRPADEALLSAMNTTPDELEKTLRSRTRRLVQGSRTLDVKRLAVAAVPPPVEVSRTALLTRLGEVLTLEEGLERVERGHRLFDAALELAPDDPGALFAKGALLARSNERPGEATAFLDRALAGDPTHATAHYYRGVTHQRESRAVDNPGEKSGLLAQARQDYQRSIELDRHLRAAVNGLADTYVGDRDLAPLGIEIAERELRNGPYLPLAVTLMELYATVGDRRAAWEVHDDRIARWLDASAEENPTGVTAAVERTDLYVAYAWHAEGRCAEVRELLQEAIAGSVHEKVRVDLLDGLETLGECAEITPPVDTEDGRNGERAHLELCGVPAVFRVRQDVAR